VLSAATYVLYTGADRIAVNTKNDAISRGVRLTHEGPPFEIDPEGFQHPSGVKVRPMTYGPNNEAGTHFLYETKEGTGAISRSELLVPDRGAAGENMLRLIGAIMLIVVLVAAGVALWVAGQVTRPLHDLSDDVRQIAKGDLQHKTRAVGAGEIELLARSIDRMTHDLGQAQHAQVELSIREREREVAAGVREALLPLTTPLIEGYDLGAAFMSSQEFGGDFHDFIERPDGRVGLLVCDVSGNGIPAALVGATARSYLRSELERKDDVLDTLRRVNRWLVNDVRRGMFVTALYVLIQPEEGLAEVFCAGHKIPLLRYAAEDQSLRVVHPEGIALGFDKGPVFDRRIEMITTPIEKGDRLVLANSAPVAIKNAEERELGEKAFYARVKKHAPLDTSKFLKALRRDLEQFAGEVGVQEDVSLVTISREA